jgi:hypothetical protein
MTARREEIIAEILAERERQFNLPGSEWDTKNTPNDWLAIAASYCLRGSSRKHTKPQAEAFEEDLIKAAAVILAALEHAAHMKTNGSLN